MRDASDLRNEIGQLRPGEIAELKVLRHSHTITLCAMLAGPERPQSDRR